MPRLRSGPSRPRCRDRVLRACDFSSTPQLPPALARLIAERGHVAEHITDIGPGDAPDRDLWRYALAHQAVIVTKDEDFADMVAMGGEAPCVVWVRVGNTRRASLVAWFEPLIEQVVAMVESGNRLIELR